MSIQRTISKTFATACMTSISVLIALTVLSGSAWALQGHRFLPSASNPFNGSDNPSFPGGFSVPQGVAVDNSGSVSAGDVYVTDYFNGVVDRFTSAGVFVSQIVPPAGVNGPATPYGVAVDPMTGDVYVTDVLNNVVDKFDPTGTYLSQIDGVTVPGNAPGGLTYPEGVAVDRNGNVYITNDGASKGLSNDGAVDEFDSTGSYVSQIAGLYAPTRVTVDNSTDPSDLSTGDVYVEDNNESGLVEGFHSQLVKYDSSHSFVSVVDGSSGLALGGVAVGSDGHVYSDRFTSIQDFESSGSPFFEFGASTIVSSEAIAVSSTTGNVYVASTSPESVVVFTPFTLEVPVVTSQAATSVLSESAVFNGTVNPNYLDTKYHVEFWTAEDPGHERSVPVDAGLGSETKSLTQVLGGLVANTTYHAVLVATNKIGTSTSEEQTFTTGALPTPEASTGSASEIAPYTATITGTLNPNGIETTYHFDIGSDTNYGAQIYGSGIFAGPTPITLNLQDLQPSTTYHYRFVASNQAGTVYGADQTFTTAAVPPALTPPTAIPLVAYTNTAFPKETIPTTPKALTNTQKLANALKACKKKPANKRVACQRQAHKRYPQAKKKHATNKK